MLLCHELPRTGFGADHVSVFQALVVLLNLSVLAVIAPKRVSATLIRSQIAQCWISKLEKLFAVHVEHGAIGTRAFERGTHLLHRLDVVILPAPEVHRDFFVRWRV